MNFEGLYRKYYKNVLKIIKYHYYGINNDDLMDISQIFWMRISKREIVDETFITFAYIVIKNLCNDFRRDNKKFDCHVELEKSTEKYEKYYAVNSELDVIEYNDKITKVRNNMKPRDKAILDLFLIGHKYGEIQKITKNSNFVVRSVIRNAAKEYQKI